MTKKGKEKGGLLEIIKYHRREIVKQVDAARRAAKFDIKLEEVEKNIKYNDEEYKKLLTGRTNNWECNLSKLDKPKKEGEKRPTPEDRSFRILIQSVGKNSIPDFEAYFEKSYNPNWEDFDIEDVEPISETPTPAPAKLNTTVRIIEPKVKYSDEHGYRFGTVMIIHKYFPCGGLEWSKDIEVISERNNLSILQYFDKYVVHGNQVTIDRYSQGLRITRIYDFTSPENILDIELIDEVLMENKSKRINLWYSNQKVYEPDNYFGGTWILRLIGLLILKFAPPKKHNEHAKIYRYDNVGQYLNYPNQRKFLEDVHINEDGFFVVEIENPIPGAFYIVEWGR